MKKQDFLSWIILATLLVFGAVIHSNLRDIRTAIQTSSLPKLTVIDSEQLSTLCLQFKEQWKAKDYAIYLIQPNAPIKTHKELASSSFDGLPILLELNNYESMKNAESYFYGDCSVFYDLTTVTIDSKNFVMIPIYRHNVIVAEMYVMYDDIPDKFENRVAEAQQLQQLIR